MVVLFCDWAHGETEVVWVGLIGRDGGIFCMNWTLALTAYTCVGHKNKKKKTPSLFGRSETWYCLMIVTIADFVRRRPVSPAFTPGTKYVGEQFPIRRQSIFCQLGLLLLCLKL